MASDKFFNCSMLSKTSIYGTTLRTLNRATIGSAIFLWYWPRHSVFENLDFFFLLRSEVSCVLAAMSRNVDDLSAGDRYQRQPATRTRLFGVLVFTGELGRPRHGSSQSSRLACLVLLLLLSRSIVFLLKPSRRRWTRWGRALLAQ